MVISGAEDKDPLVSRPPWRRKEHDHVGSPIHAHNITAEVSFLHWSLLNGYRSFVIDHLGESSLAEDSGIAYHYFDYKSQQPLRDIVAALVKQFCLFTATIPDPVLDLFALASNDEPRILRVLQLLSRQFNHSYIILDGLNEHVSFGKHGMQQFFESLMCTSSRLFLTSRLVAPEISETLFFRGEQVEIVATEEEVCCYIEDRIAQSPASSHLDRKLKDQIISILMRSSQVGGIAAQGKNSLE